MQHFRKYELTPTQWAAARKKIEVTTTNPEGEPVTSWNNELVAIVVELGKLVKTPAVLDSEGEVITEAVYATKESVDIVWAAEPLAAFDTYLVWPLPVGVSSMGYTLDQEYSQAFCAANPEAAYCQPPVPPTEL